MVLMLLVLGAHLRGQGCSHAAPRPAAAGREVAGCWENAEQPAFDGRSKT